MTRDLIWEIYRDGLLCAKADSHESVTKIVRRLKRVYPNSQFKARYIGKNLGARSPEECTG